MRTIIEIYFGINLLIVGLGIDPEDKEGSFIWFNIAIVFLFGLPMIVAAFIWDNWLTPLFKALQIKFFWQFYFSHKWDVTSKTVLQQLNAYLYYPSVIKKSLKNRIYKHTIKLIFKRNNFEPVEYKTGLWWLETIPKTYKVKVISPDAWINDRDFINTRITKKQFVQNMKTSAISHTITFDIDKF